MITSGTLLEDNKTRLEGNITRDEIGKALSDLIITKHLVLMGSFFFKVIWRIIGYEFVKAIRFFPNQEGCYKKSMLPILP